MTANKILTVFVTVSYPLKIMADKIISAKKGKGHKEKVRSSANKSRTLDNKLSQPQVLDPQRLERENKEKFDKQTDYHQKYNYPVAAGMVGHWVRPDPRDTEMQVRREAAKMSGIGNGAITPWGIQSAPDDLGNWLMQKKEQEEYWQQLKLASYLIDSKNPATQDPVYTIFPELRDYPEQVHTQNLQVQEALRTMLRDGTVRGKEDNMLVYKLIQDDFILPMWPIWDPNGLILDQVYRSDDFWNWQTKAIQRGFFNPRKWHTGDMSGDANYVKMQRNIKKMILKRLYPGLRDADDTTMDNFINNISAASGYNTEPGYSLKQYNPGRAGALDGARVETKRANRSAATNAKILGLKGYNINEQIDEPLIPGFDATKLEY